MKKTILESAILVGVAVVALIWGHHRLETVPASVATDSSKHTIKIGATLPLTGNAADIGISAQQALKMAHEKWENRGTKYDYELIVEDDALDAKRVAMIVNRFVKLDRVNAVLSMFSIGAGVASSIAGDAQCIHLTCSFGSQPAEGFYNFNNHTQYNESTEAIVAVLKKQGVKTISLCTSNNIGSLDHTEALIKKLGEDGTIKVLASETFNPGLRSFTMVIQKMLRHGKPDIFYFDGLKPDILIFAKNLKEVTGELNLTTYNDFIDFADKTPFDGLWFVMGSYGTDAFVEEFKKINNSDLFVCGGNLYDNLDILIWAFENTEPRVGDVIPHSDDVVQTLHSIKDWPGAIGNISVDEAGIIQSRALTKIIRDGELFDFE